LILTYLRPLVILRFQFEFLQDLFLFFVYSTGAYSPDEYATSLIPDIGFRACLYDIPHFYTIMATSVYPSTVRNILALVPSSDLEKNHGNGSICKELSTTSFSV